MPKIVLTDVVKRWKDFYATDHVSFEIPDRAFITLLGPSGCGKTTILRMIAGLETPTSGQITIGDQIVFDSDAGINVPANKRKVGFLFQNYALWPNMTVYQNITFGLKNVKDEMPTYDYIFKTRNDILRILQNPKKVIELVNDSRDKRGRIVDDRAIVKIIDEFTVSAYTAKEIFKLHLEEGGVEEKVQLAVESAKSAIQLEKNKWLQKNVLIEQDGKLVSIPDYANKKNSLSEKELNSYLQHCYNLEKIYIGTMKNTEKVHKSLNIRFDDSKVEENLKEIIQSVKGLLCEKDIVSSVEKISSNLPLVRKEKDELRTILEKAKTSLGTIGLGEDYQKLIVNYLRQYLLSLAEGDEKKTKNILHDLDVEVNEIKKQISNQVSSFIDKLPKIISGATVETELENTIKNLDYLPEEQVNLLKEELTNLMKTSTVFDKRGNKEALKRFKEGLTALEPNDRSRIDTYVPKIGEAVLSGHIADIYLSVRKELSNYNSDVIHGILDEIQGIAITYVNNSDRNVKSTINKIEKIATYLVEKTKDILSIVYDQLKEPSERYGSTINEMVGEIKNIENIISSLTERACHLSSERALDKEEIELSLRRVARIVKIEEFMDRYPNELSGGQQQRVAIARTLAPGPKVLFMDEPLSNLDAKLRLEMRSELKRLHLETGATFVYVTHDQLEAMTLATHICLLNNGVLQQYDAPLTIYNKPSNLFVADFVGNPSITLIEVKATQNQEGNIDLRFFKNRKAVFIPNNSIDLQKLIKERDETIAQKEERLSLLKKQKSYVEKGNKDTVFNYHIPTINGTIDRKDEKKPENDEYVIAIRPEYFSLTTNGKGLSGEVYSAMPSGMETTLKTNVDGFILTSVNFGASDFKIGEKIEIDITGDNILLFDKVTGDLISTGRIEIC